MSRRNKITSPSYVLNMDAVRWSFRTENANCVNCYGPDSTGTGGWQFLIPRMEDNADGKVGYIGCAHTAPITASRIEGIFSIAALLGTQFADAKEPFNDATPASVGFCLSTADFYGEFGRWWGKARVSLESLMADARIVSMPLLPEAWQNVNGKPGTDYPNEFKAALASPAMVWLTFGAGGDFGHGIRTTGGSAYFRAEGIRFV